MSGKVIALGGERLEDLHALLDEAIAAGATAGVLIVINEDDHPDGAWSAYGTGGISPAERTFIYQQLIVIEVADQMHPDEDGHQG